MVDVVVVGLGVGGEEVAGRLAEAGLSVVGIEQGLVGGECPYWGCVPSKMMIRAANLLAEARRVDGMAGQADVHPDWTPVARRIREEATDDWDDQVAVDRFTGKGGRFVRGYGRLLGPGRVAVGDETFEASRGVVIGVGTSPAIPPIRGLAGTPYWTHREAIEAETLPSSLVVLGGGAVGLELAQVFARFGVRVSVVEALDRLIAPEEPESSALVAGALAADGVEARTSASVDEVGHAHEEFQVRLADGSTLRAEALLVSTGRRAELDELGLETVGVDPGARFVKVDERMRAGDRLWAVGDVTGHGGFTHVAMYQAGIAVRDILGEDGPPADYRALPRVTFHRPRGRVGGHDRAAGAGRRPGRTGRPDPAAQLGPRLDPQGGQRRVHQADRGRPARRAGGGDLGRAGRWRGAVGARRRRARRGAGGPAAAHDLRVPDLPPGDRGRATRLVVASRHTHRYAREPAAVPAAVAADPRPDDR
jgi:pyruvate/2-oxoglutarate dehydrogenase complex dihydrolipoamide dehydrogenase (E3) component